MNNSKHWDEGYTRFNNNFWLNKELDPYELKLWGILLTFVRYDLPKEIGTGYLSSVSNIGISKVTRAIKKFEELGYITILNRGGGSTPKTISINHNGYAANIEGGPLPKERGALSKRTGGPLPKERGALYERTGGPLPKERGAPVRKNYKELTNKELNKKEITNKYIYSPIDKKNTDQTINTPNKYDTEINEVINHLNLKASVNFRPNSKSCHKFISARLRDGYSVDDLKDVIDSKVDDWFADPKMRPYLRPSTLFNEEKFEGYVNLNSKKLKDSLDKKLLNLIKRED